MSASPILLGSTLALGAYAVFARARRAENARRLSTASVRLIDWMRGLSAVAVLLGHVRGLFMQDYESLRHPSPLWKVFYAASGLGHQAVIVFFILSGFLVGSTVLARSSEGRWDFGEYFTRRMARLYTVLIPGLGLTAAWDGAGLLMFGAKGLYGGHLDAAHLTMPDVRTTLSVGHLLGNLAFLQHLFIAPFGTNGPLWSLSYEFWSYLLFPLIVRATITEERARSRVTYLALAAILLSAGGYKLNFYFGIWLLGAGLAAWFRRAALPNFSRVIRALAWVAFGAAVALGRAGRVSDWYADALLGVTTAVLLGVTLQGEDSPQSAPAWSARAAAWLASFSYTLYVVHYPLLAFLFSAVMAGERLVPTSTAVLVVLLVTVAVLFLYAYPVSLLTEAKTDAIRRRLAPSAGRLR